DPKTMYESKKNLAKFFQNIGNLELSIEYFKNALKIADGIPNSPSRIEAAQNVGTVLKNYSKFRESADFFDQSRKLARELNDSESEKIASKSLIEVKSIIADQLCEMEQNIEAISQYNQCLEIRHQSFPNDEKIIIDLLHRIGKAHKEIGEIDTALKHLEMFREMCKKHGDKAKEGMAQAALASCYEK
ncbi:hypothetical protein HK096_010481, partial [Nowakowskiella sp. JEL0078]